MPILLFFVACGPRVPPSANVPTETVETPAVVEPEPLGERVLLVGAEGEDLPEGYTLPATRLARGSDSPPGPCVVLIAGSGPTDRDWTSPLVAGTNGSGRQIAEALFEQGIGSIRYDKGAIAENQWPIAEVNLALYGQEAALAWRSLAEDPSCDRVSFLGNSEGSMHAFRAAVSLQDDPRFGGVISLSGPAMTVMDTIKLQLLSLYVPDSDEERAIAMAVLDDLEARIRLLPEMEDGPPDLSSFRDAAGIWMQAVNPVQGELVRALLLLDPMEAVGSYRGPALIMAADNDIQVAPTEADDIFAGLAPSSALRRLIVVENANHVFKHEPRTREDADIMSLALQYSAPDVPLAEGLIDEITNFLVSLEGGSEAP